MKLIFDSNESAAPVAPLLHDKQEEVNNLLDEIEEMLTQAEQRLERQGKASVETQPAKDAYPLIEGQ